MSTLAQRVLQQEQKVTKMKALNVDLNTKERIEALLTLVKSSVTAELREICLKTQDGEMEWKALNRLPDWNDARGFLTN